MCSYVEAQFLLLLLPLHSKHEKLFFHLSRLIFFQIIKKQFYIQHFTRFVKHHMALEKLSRDTQDTELGRSAILAYPVERKCHTKQMRVCTRLNWIWNWFVLQLNVNMKNYPARVWGSRRMCGTKNIVNGWARSAWGFSRVVWIRVLRVFESLVH